jgi:hypothetical protein
MGDIRNLSKVEKCPAAHQQQQRKPEIERQGGDQNKAKSAQPR